MGAAETQRTAVVRHAMEALGLDKADSIGDEQRIVRVLEDVWQHGCRFGRTVDLPEPAGTPSETSEAPRGSQVWDGFARSTEAKGDPTEADSWGELRGWWEQTAHDEIDGLVSKMVEYGGARRATDLTEVGAAMVACGVPPLGGGGGPLEVQDAWQQELGVYFYLRGKFARWTAAIAEGRPVSDDTLHDIAVYVRMAQRIRARGGWPV